MIISSREGKLKTSSTMKNKKPKLLMVCRTSFGYQVTLYHWCKNLRHTYDITYICLNDRFAREEIALSGVRVKYVFSTSHKLIRGIKYIFESLKEITKNYDLCIIEYFTGCVFLRWFRPFANLILDIQTGSINNSKTKRICDNLLLRIEAFHFKNKTILSERLSNKLKLGGTHIVPLGAHVISEKQKKFSRIDLVYVGTLQNRRIEKTVLGFDKFYQEYKNKYDFSYTIIGRGADNEEDELRELVKSLALQGVVEIVGYVKNEDLKVFLDSCNVGVSFIPITEYYDLQPPTKTFEYLMSGMPVIATKTSENCRVVNNNNGVLINDTIEGFYQGLTELYKRRNDFKSDQIRSTVKEYTWENIAINNLKPYLDELH